MSRLGRLFQKFRPGREVSRQDVALPAASTLWVVAGLGNPGQQYACSRHNAGFRVAERLAARAHMPLDRRKFNGLFAEIPTAGGDALIVMPQTFYNRSGDCVSAIISYFKVPVERLIVVHDEMDLPVGQLRIKRGGGDAGNRGVRSIIEALGSSDFIRVRIGIGHAADDGDTVDYLLKPLASDDLRAGGDTIDRAADAVVAIMRDGLERAMNAYNQRA
jgi:peptidyl-tRNA hydrolase, PTH1 family